MKKLLIILCCVLSISISAQTVWDQSADTAQFSGQSTSHTVFRSIGSTIIYLWDTTNAPKIAGNLISWQNPPVDSSLWWFDGTKWVKVIGSGGNPPGTTPTWQQTLDVTDGSTLTHDNSISAGEFNFFLGGDNWGLFLDSSTTYMQGVNHSADGKTFYRYHISADEGFDYADEGPVVGDYFQEDSNSAPVIQSAWILDTSGAHYGNINNSESPTAIIPFRIYNRTKLVNLPLVDNTTGNVLSLDASHNIISIPQSGFGSTNIFDSTLIGQASTPMTYNGTTDWGNTSWAWSNMLNFSATVANISTIGDVNASLSNNAGSGTITQIAANSITNDADTLYLKVDDYGSATNGYVLSIADVTTGRTEWVSGASTTTFDASLIAQGSTPMTYNSNTDWNSGSWTWNNMNGFQINSPTYTNGLFAIDGGDGIVRLGDFTGTINTNRIIINDNDGNFVQINAPNSLTLTTSTTGKLFLNVSNAVAATNGDVPYLVDNTTGEIGWSSLNNKAWLLTGNSGTTPGTNFIGTIDDNALVFKVNNQFSGTINDGTENTSFGYQSLIVNASGIDNAAFGHTALAANTDGVENTAIGAYALVDNTIGSDNVAVGMQTLTNNTEGNDNLAIGAGALGSNVTATGNVGIGRQSLSFNIGDKNTAVGYQSLYFNTTGSHNVGVGDSAGMANSIVINYSISLGSKSRADSSLQFALPDTVKYWKFRGANYTFPATQTNGVLTNTGGVLTWAAVSGFANTALSNLASVAINTSLLPGTDNSIDLGNSSSPKRWRNIYSTYDLIGTLSGSYTEINPALIYTGSNSGDLASITGARFVSNSATMHVGEMDATLATYNSELQFTSTIISESIAAAEVARFNSTGLAIGTTTNTTAKLKLAAGTTSVAPLIINAGTNLTSTLAGAIENDGTHLYYTATNGGTRYQLDQQSASNQTLTISSPLTGTSYDGSAPVSIGITNAAADGSTKGAAAFNATYFDASSGVITIDATNGLATSGQVGYATSNQIISAISDVEDGQGGVVATGTKGSITIPYSATIVNWYVACDQSGSIQFDIKRSGSSIVGGGNKPLVSSAQSGNAAVSGWTSTAIAAGDILTWVVDSSTTVTNCSCVLKVNK